MVNESDIKIAVVLNAYKRTEFLELQLDAIEKQTIKASDIYVWQNRGQDIPEYLKSRFILANCSENLGVWARFAFALNIDADYICLLDDDTIPGSKWFENCVDTIKSHDGLLGTRGLQYLSSKRYHPYKEFGWAYPNEDTVQVDIVGHAWFFKREHLAMFWSELPPKNFSRVAGEDIHFSYMLQKFGLKTFVPPHPSGDQELWGSLPHYGKELGTNEAAISQGSDATSKFDIAYKYYISKGFQLTLDLSERLSSGVVVGSGVRKNKFFRKIVERNPSMKKYSKVFLKQLEKLGIHI
ncbi:glycosyltransferase family 2 protein [Aliivibrio fischeri]|uniref:glycosyltransferase family 2 protein n=1 Tax=Aliivibrio fischeri TaxID=668 RepID=UPI0007C4DD90|nr:glycosyltransferase [Aliivibrio fischeri]MBP3140691.1 hypothetical protein [Aliivibrio fischeri]MBP3156002.1 hypothetical protein [Aliivibrio fischeri]MCE7574469.1 hypothetical protein [Aliivibrio fischeri]